MATWKTTTAATTPIRLTTEVESCNGIAHPREGERFFSSPAGPTVRSRPSGGRELLPP
jgi:hypothetical protein